MRSVLLDTNLLLLLTVGMLDRKLIGKHKRTQEFTEEDFDLYKEISRKGYNVINFNHLRMQHMIR